MKSSKSGKSNIKNVYDREYDKLLDWMTENWEEYIIQTMLLGCFGVLAETFSQSSLWSKYSLVKMTLLVNKNISYLRTRWKISLHGKRRKNNWLYHFWRRWNDQFEIDKGLHVFTAPRMFKEAFSELYTRPLYCKPVRKNTFGKIPIIIIAKYLGTTSGASVPTLPTAALTLVFSTRVQN